LSKSSTNLSVIEINEPEGSVAKFEKKLAASAPKAGGLEAARCRGQLNDAPVDGLRAV
jgi:hypothetical protein